MFPSKRTKELNINKEKQSLNGILYINGKEFSNNNDNCNDNADMFKFKDNKYDDIRSKTSTSIIE